MGGNSSGFKTAFTSDVYFMSWLSQIMISPIMESTDVEKTRVFPMQTRG